MFVMAITTGLWRVRAVSGASLPGLSLTLTLTLTLTFPVSPVPATGIAFPLAFGCDCRYLRLVLRVERCLGLIQIDLGNGGRRHRHLLGRVEDLVSRFEDAFVSFFIELFVTYVSPYIYWQL